MDLADDADGRVVIFSVEVEADHGSAVTQAPRRRRGADVALDVLGRGLDSAYAGVVIAVGLAVVLILGLVLLRR